MKVVYCDRCKDISIKSRLEPDVCNRCSGPARPVRYSRPWQYYAGSGILLGATLVLIFVPIPDLLVRVTILGIALAIAVAFSAWSIRATRARVRRAVEDAAKTEAKA